MPIFPFINRYHLAYRVSFYCLICGLVVWLSRQTDSTLCVNEDFILYFCTSCISGSQCIMACGYHATVTTSKFIRVPDTGKVEPYVDLQSDPKQCRQCTHMPLWQSSPPPHPTPTRWYPMCSECLLACNSTPKCRKFSCFGQLRCLRWSSLISLINR